MVKQKIKFPTIRVKNSGVVKMKFFNDFPDGNLVIGEGRRDIPFAIKRVYFINNLYNKIAKRGLHAHKKLEQVIFCVNGSFLLRLDDGRTQQSLRMDSPYYGVRLGPRLWHKMSDFSADCVILVLASDYFRESDYIRDYAAFQKHLKIKKD